MADQLRRDALGCYGNTLIRTPNLDRLADGAITFTHACCPTPICVASRMSFITGHRASRHRFVANSPLPGPIPELPTLMGLLHRAGYHTEGVGKMHFGGRLYGFQKLQSQEEAVTFRIDDDYLLYLKAHGVRTRCPQGLRDLLYYQPQTCGIPEEHSQSRWVASQSCRFLREHGVQRPGQPFLLWSSWIAPHPPFAPCEPYDSLYDPAAFPLPVHAERPLETLPHPARGHRVRLQGAHLDPDRIRRIRALYAGQVTQVDDGVGSILDELRRLGLAENTVILFVSDHGDMLGDHGLSQKNVPYRASVAIPMLLKWPGRTQAGRRCRHLVGLEDFVPTVVAELGLAYDSGAGALPGMSLLGEPGGGLSRDREFYAIDYGHAAARWISLRSRELAYTFWASGGREELYDLVRDPDETANAAAARPRDAATFREQVSVWESRRGLAESFADGRLRAFPERGSGLPPGITLNEGTWPENLPPEEAHTVESFADAFSRAVQKETTLSPDKLDLASYRRCGGPPLIGTPWEDAWQRADGHSGKTP